MAILANRSYIHKLSCARIHCCLAHEDAYILNDIAADIFYCYDRDAFVSFRNDISIGNHGTGTDLSGTISESQLVVAIISGNFLEQKASDGSMEEFRYAIQNNIPVLPIVIESDLEEKFNKKCGKLELIFKYSDSYYEVLKENLRRILANEEIKKQIREHFYGNIFLSYRRSDLKHAKETMRTVHSFKNCTDVGIWYDGALVPGMDYEKEIFEHLSKCDCVLMIVTPRLLEPENFIMKEYPRVKKSGMKIIPYIAEDVDVNELSKYYNGLFDEYQFGIKGENELMMALSAIYPEHNDNWDAEHNYYIGMAHLYGVDFENDVEKAINYFNCSADNGYIAALAKLVEIYEQGIGTEVNPEYAIKYQKEYVSRLKDKEKLPCISSTILVKEMLKLGSLFEKNKDYQEAGNTYREIYSLFDLNPKAEQQKDYYIALAEIYERMGLLEKSLANYYEARQSFNLAENCLKNAERVAIGQDERKQVDLVYSRIAENIAMTILDLGNEVDLNLADMYIQLAIKPYEDNFYADNEDNNKKKILSRLYYEEGKLERRIFDVMCRENGTDKGKLIDQLEWISGILGNALEVCTDIDFDESIKNIADYYQLILILEELKNTYYVKFLLQPSSANLIRYERYLDQMMNIFMNVNQDATARNALINKINECIHMGEFFATRGYKEKAKGFYEWALKGMRKAGLSEQGEEIETVKSIIEQLS